MEPKNNVIVEADHFFEFIDDASQQSELLPHSAPVFGDEEKAFAQAITQLQCARRRGLLTWREIYEVVYALGYRKVEQPTVLPLPPQVNGSPRDSVPASGAMEG